MIHTILENIRQMYIPQQRKRQLKAKHPTIYDRLLETYDWVDESTTFNEILYLVSNNINSRPLCEKCQSYVSWDTHNLKYHRFCSSKCSIHIAVKAASNDKSKEKRESTILSKYGVNNIFKDKTVIEEIKKVKRENRESLYGCIRDYRTLKNQFDWRVKYHTNKTYEKYKNIIDPNGLRGRHYHVDHMYSKYDAFNNDVPIEILCHWSNLILVPYLNNLEKNKKSSKSIEELYEHYYTLRTEDYDVIIRNN